MKIINEADIRLYVSIKEKERKLIKGSCENGAECVHYVDELPTIKAILRQKKEII